MTRILHYFGVILLVQTIQNAEIIQKVEKNCTCVPFYQCSDDENGVLILDGKGLLDVRFLENNHYCPGHFDICCNIPSKATLDISKTPKLTGCGYRNSEFFPWSGGLYFKEFLEFQPTYRCGVSIIHQKVILTAAHCVDQQGFWFVRLGNLIRTISKIIPHPDYNPSNLQNDIAVAVLDSEIPTTDKLNTICIPPQGSDLNSSNNCTAPSWIKNPKSSVKYLTVMKLPIISRTSCQGMLRGTRLGSHFQLHQSFICAGGAINEDTCGGDGGSPLICPVPGQPGRFHQAGIVSWGIGCGKSQVPGVYVNLPVFRDWIDYVMRQHGFEIYTYRY